MFNFAGQLFYEVEPLNPWKGIKANYNLKDNQNFC